MNTFMVGFTEEEFQAYMKIWAQIRDGITYINLDINDVDILKRVAVRAEKMADGHSEIMRY